MGDALRVNGRQISWSSAKLKIDGESFTGVTAISYEQSLERSKAYGMGRAHGPRGRSAGKYTAGPVSLTMAKSSVEALRVQLAKKSQSGNSYSGIFEMVLQYIETDDDMITVEFEACAIAKETNSDAEGTETLSTDVELDVMRIRINGRYLFDDSEGA